MPRRLVFVYNADSGLFNTVSDIAHKILSPETYACRLCELTHGHFRVRREWVGFLERLDAECSFLHRDEVQKQHGVDSQQAPRIYLHEDARLIPWVEKEEIEACPDLAALKTLIESRLGELEKG
ncbi:hypothetical protein QVG61_05250 [Thiohalobacter sp. IOR34]|uniref:hypothetical protein n=1 Tax=Thiohalobacter sp. IOR34 TaxID=3057176 RepID=UPI0025B087D4|nr:hypothetical protein [Thiohalobacter sp. IOR34]WJW76496.1 hypothetical protein QVG61_05250 [Thiohalobacter sp. IOR34]